MTNFFFLVWLSIKDDDDDDDDDIKSPKERKERFGRIYVCMCVCNKSDHYNSYCTKHWSLSLFVVVIFFCLQKNNAPFNMCGSILRSESVFLSLLFLLNFFRINTMKTLRLLRIRFKMYVCILLRVMRYNSSIPNDFVVFIYFSLPFIFEMEWVNGRNKMNLTALKFIVLCTIRSWNEAMHVYKSRQGGEKEREGKRNSMAGKQTWHQDFDAAFMFWKIFENLKKKSLNEIYSPSSYIYIYFSIIIHSHIYNRTT